MALRRHPVVATLIAMAVVSAGVTGWSIVEQRTIAARDAAREATNAEATAALQDLVGEGKATDPYIDRAFALLWVLQQMDGSPLLDRAYNAQWDLEKRIELATMARDRLPEGSLERSLWGMTLGLWMLGDKRPNGSLQVLMETEAELAEWLVEDDPLMIQVSLLVDCSRVKALFHRQVLTPLTDAQLIWLDRVEVRIVERYQSLPEFYRESPIALMAMRTVNNMSKPRLRGDRD